ncbi:unnamed protein product, partial [Polarella glacialis]
EMARRRFARIPRAGCLLKLCLLAVLPSSWTSIRDAFVGVPAARHSFLQTSPAMSTVRFAEPGMMESETAETETSEEEDQGSEEGLVGIVQGSKRFLVQWVSEETAEQFRERVSLLTGVPAEKQQLKLADKQLLGEGQTLLSQYEVNGAIRLIWLEDLRSPQERGEKGETILDKIGTLWKLDNITILSLIVVAVEFVKDLLPVLLKWGYPMPY